MNEKDYIEETMKKYLSNQYDSLMSADKISPYVAIEYESKEDYIKKNFDLYKSTSLDGDIEVLSEEELNFIRNSDNNKSSSDVSPELFEISEKIIRGMDREANITVSIDKEKILLKRGMNKFELSNSEMISLLNQLNLIGINNLYGTSIGYIKI